MQRQLFHHHLACRRRHGRKEREGRSANLQNAEEGMQSVENIPERQPTFQGILYAFLQVQRIREEASLFVIGPCVAMFVNKTRGG